MRCVCCLRHLGRVLGVCCCLQVADGYQWQQRGHCWCAGARRHGHSTQHQPGQCAGELLAVDVFLSRCMSCWTPKHTCSTFSPTTQRPCTVLHEAVALLADVCRFWRCNRSAAGSCWSMCRPHCLSAQTWQQTRCSRTCLQVGRGQGQLLLSAVVFVSQPAAALSLPGSCTLQAQPPVK